MFYTFDDVIRIIFCISISLCARRSTSRPCSIRLMTSSVLSLFQYILVCAQKYKPALVYTFDVIRIIFCFSITLRACRSTRRPCLIRLVTSSILYLFQYNLVCAQKYKTAMFYTSYVIGMIISSFLYSYLIDV